MKIDLYFTIPEVDPGEVATGAAIVIDVIRATSTIVEALASGARAIVPVLSAEDAIRMANSLGRDATLLCGERRGLKIEGFDLGNSPREFTPSRVAGKQLIMTTTNGTRAFLAASEAERVVSASFTNLAAAAEAVREFGRTSIVCAGREDRFSLDDAVCGGFLVRALEGLVGDCELNDAAGAALSFTERYEPTPAFLEGTAAGRALFDIGLQDDLPLCAELDRHALAPVMVDRSIRLP